MSKLRAAGAHVTMQRLCNCVCSIWHILATAAGGRAHWQRLAAGKESRVSLEILLLEPRSSRPAAAAQNDGQVGDGWWRKSCRCSGEVVGCHWAAWKTDANMATASRQAVALSKGDFG